MSNTEEKSLVHSEYWDEHYAEAKPDEQVHEWYRSFVDLEQFFERHLFQVKGPESAPKILHLGSGDSTIPQDFASKGYDDQICIDFSSVVVQAMSKKHANIDGITWEQGDVRQLGHIQSESIDVAFDKGTLDSMIHGSPWSPPEDVLENTSRYMREVFRILTHDGIFICVTFRQPHFVRPLLNCADVTWNMNVHALADSETSFGYHGFILTKGIISVNKPGEDTPSV